MILTTTPTLEGHPIESYCGLVSGEAILGANFVKDFFANFTNVFGGRSGSYERELHQARDVAIKEMADAAKKLTANAVVGIELDYAVISTNSGSMILVTASGTAVKIRE